MKAESFVFTGIQKPLTVLGLPPKLLMLLVAMTGVSFGAFIAIGFRVSAMLIPVVAFGVAWFKLWRRNNKDRHFGNYLFALPRFWARRKRPASILAGRPYRPGRPV